jgi:hypothetical protein
MANDVLQHPHWPPEGTAHALPADAHRATLVPWRFGLAASAAFSAFYLACAVGVALFPQATLDLFNAWFHGLDLNLLRPAGGRPLTAQQFVVGWLAVIAVAFPVGAILAWTYNASGPTHGA